ncbi:DEAD/DEAH box helicase [Eisenibacter elegans]|jgi:ATP-dependent RNA helicase DeaD|uniref:DEAD/DEAH box helicase n=1 Tax=Eisenibacter elegans TaxID=997 RepID=UPI00047C513D|nr:DEAD/DEAH box helicase [Eisenibacter elegans]
MSLVTFEQLSLSSEVQQALQTMGFSAPSPIQAQAIPFALEGRDLLGQAQTGTGKTAAFAIPTLENIDTTLPYVQALVLCPTRELALQVSEEFGKIGQYIPRLSVLAVYGGESIDRQIRGIKRGAQIIVGTPGRVIDHLKRGTLQIDQLRTIVLDEADEMLNMGFVDEIESILRFAPEDRQTLLFSATMPEAIMRLTKKYQRDPEIVKVIPQNLTANRIEQTYFPVREAYKAELLIRLIEVNDVKIGVIFCNTKQRVDELVATLQARGYMAEGLHGDLTQMTRTVVMNKFRQGIVNLLVATDVAARGIDVDDVEVVFNYDIPHDPEYYVHRIGRTGRAGKSGKAFSFVERYDVRNLKNIERYARAPIVKGEIPTVAEVQKRRQARFLLQCKEEMLKATQNDYQHLVDEMLGEGFTLEQITAALLKLQLGEQNQRDALQEALAQQNTQTRDSYDKGGRQGGKYGNRRDERRGGERGGSRDRFQQRERSGGSTRTRFSEEGMTKIQLSIGKEHNVSKADIVGAITGETGVRGHDIGLIRVYDEYTHVDVQSSHAQKVLQKMQHRRIKGNAVTLEIAQ